MVRKRKKSCCVCGKRDDRAVQLTDKVMKETRALYSELDVGGNQRLKLMSEDEKALPREDRPTDKLYSSELVFRCRDCASAYSRRLPEVEDSAPPRVLRSDSRIDELEQQLQSYRDELQELHESRGRLTASLEEQQSINGRLRDQLEASHGTVRGLELKLSKVLQQLETRTNLLNESREHCRENEATISQLRTLQAEQKAGVASYVSYIATRESALQESEEVRQKREAALKERDEMTILVPLSSHPLCTEAIHTAVREREEMERDALADALGTNTIVSTSWLIDLLLRCGHRCQRCMKMSHVDIHEQSAARASGPRFRISVYCVQCSEHFIIRGYTESDDKVWTRRFVVATLASGVQLDMLTDLLAALGIKPLAHSTFYDVWGRIKRPLRRGLLSAFHGDRDRLLFREMRERAKRRLRNGVAPAAVASSVHFYGPQDCHWTKTRQANSGVYGVIAHASKELLESQEFKRTG